MAIANQPPPMPEDTVSDEELLYRRVQQEYVGLDTENKPFYHSSAFNDRNKQPSVDRAHINEFDPQPTRFKDDMSNAVASLVARRVRAIVSVIDHSAGGTGTPHVITVLAAPVRDHPTLDDNPAHAQIQSQRPMTDGAFNNLKRALARMSMPILAPFEPVVYLTTTKKVYHLRTCKHLKRVKTAVAFTKLPASARPCCGCNPQPWTPDAPTAPAG